MKPNLQDYLFCPRDVVEEMQARRRAARKTKRTPSEQVRRRTANPKAKVGLRYTRRSYRQAIVRACQKAGVPEWSPLQLRHTAATVIRAKYGIEAAQLILGHARADVTQVYAERDLARARTIMAEIG